MEIEQEELYICDHAEDGCKCVGEFYKPHTSNGDWDGSWRGNCSTQGNVKFIPYKEKEKCKE